MIPKQVERAIDGWGTTSVLRYEGRVVCIRSYHVWAAVGGTNKEVRISPPQILYLLLDTQYTAEKAHAVVFADDPHASLFWVHNRDFPTHFERLP